MNTYIKKKYACLEEAEDDLGINYFTGGLHCSTSDSSPSYASPVSSSVVAHSPNWHINKESHCHGDTITDIVNSMGNMSDKIRTDLIQNLLVYHMQIQFGCQYTAYIPPNFVELCCKAFKELLDSGKDNIVYHLAKGLGTKRPDGCGPRLPTDRMPFGLLSYNIRYFSSDSVNNLKADQDFIEWETSMYANFGHKWLCLQRGPGFAYDEDPEEVGPSVFISNEDCTPTPLGTGTANDLLQQAWNDVMGNDRCSSPTEKEIAGSSYEHNDNQVSSTTDELSFLWARLNLQEQEEASAGDNPSVIEALHGVTPQEKHKRVKKTVDPMKAKLNVAGHSLSTIQRHIQSSPFTKDSNIQVS